MTGRSPQFTSGPEAAGIRPTPLTKISAKPRPCPALVRARSQRGHSEAGLHPDPADTRICGALGRRIADAVALPRSGGIAACRHPPALVFGEAGRPCTWVAPRHCPNRRDRTNRGRGPGPGRSTDSATCMFSAGCASPAARCDALRRPMGLGHRTARLTSPVRPAEGPPSPPVGAQSPDAEASDSVDPLAACRAAM